MQRVFEGLHVLQKQSNKLISTFLFSIIKQNVVDPLKYLQPQANKKKSSIMKAVTCTRARVCVCVSFTGKAGINKTICVFWSTLPLRNPTRKTFRDDIFPLRLPLWRVAPVIQQLWKKIVFLGVRCAFTNSKSSPSPFSQQSVSTQPYYRNATKSSKQTILYIFIPRRANGTPGERVKSKITTFRQHRWVLNAIPRALDMWSIFTFLLWTHLHDMRGETSLRHLQTEGRLILDGACEKHTIRKRVTSWLSCEANDEFELSPPYPPSWRSSLREHRRYPSAQIRPSRWRNAPRDPWRWTWFPSGRPRDWCLADCSSQEPENALEQSDGLRSYRQVSTSESEKNRWDSQRSRTTWCCPSRFPPRRSLGLRCRAILRPWPRLWPS